MRWSERQVAMLREMGIRVWAREAPERVGLAQEGGDALVVAEPPPAEALVVEPAPTPQAAPGRVVPPLDEPGSAPALVRADWLIVGEPFDAIGGAGDAAAAGEQERLLDNMLHAIRVSRGAPVREQRACYLPIVEGRPLDLDAAIADVAPRCILVLGRAAASALLGLDEPPGRLRERVYERGGVPVVVSFALPYLLRHAADKAKAWADLCRAVALLD